MHCASSATPCLARLLHYFNRPLVALLSRAAQLARRRVAPLEGGRPLAPLFAGGALAGPVHFLASHLHPGVLCEHLLDVREAEDVTVALAARVAARAEGTPNLEDRACYPEWRPLEVDLGDRPKWALPGLHIFFCQKGLRLTSFWSKGVSPAERYTGLICASRAFSRTIVSSAYKSPFWEK